MIVEKNSLSMMNNTQVKSRERVSAHGEVFTAEREVKAMCDMVNDECIRTEATFLEPACGDGNFLEEILKRKLSAITHDNERNSLIALASLYGIDILSDNVEVCRRRLYALWDSHSGHSETARTRAREILEKNIVCGDTLKPAVIIFTEWKFPEGSITPSTKRFTLQEADGEHIQFTEQEP